ncbi:MAG: SprT-like domain-containing protein [Gammaproteobacteria bacterium]|nr:SprT-like domain-containing protein [Gammaproteobacteria bacterium]
MASPTQEYEAYQYAYDYLKKELFDVNLPPCLITFQRQRRAYGYFYSYGFADRNNPTLRTDEIALNPDTFVGCTDKEILSTLVHELCHLWQAHEGKPGRSGYHNRQWAREMMRVGLQPISLDNPGKMTGQRVTHEIIPGGRFDLAADQLLATGFRLRWQSADVVALNGKVTMKVAKPKRNKVKFTCDECGQNAWAKPRARLICGLCQEPLARQERW